MRITHSRCGFTLVELLVVIAIVALLVSILLPTLKSARDTARRVLCGSQERQLYLSVLLYANDYDQWTPIRNEVGGGVCSDQISDGMQEMPYSGTGANPSYESNVGGFLQKYGAAHRLWYCPCFQGKQIDPVHWPYWFSWMENESPTAFVNTGNYTYQPCLMVGGVVALSIPGISSIGNQVTIRVGQSFWYWDGYTYKYERCFMLEDTMGDAGDGAPGWAGAAGDFISSHFDGKNQGGNGVRGDGSIEWQPVERWQYVLDGRWDVSGIWQRGG